MTDTAADALQFLLAIFPLGFYDSRRLLSSSRLHGEALLATTADEMQRDF